MNTYTLTFNSDLRGFVIEAHDMAEAIEMLNSYRNEGFKLSGIATVCGTYYPIK